MIDPAHKATEQRIRELEKKIRKEYSEAETGVRERLLEHWGSFQLKDEKKRELVKAGKLSEEDYQHWRTGQIAVGKRWKDMRKTIAQDYMNANNIARKIADDSKADVFAINGNYAFYEIEKNAGIDMSFSLYNHDGVVRLIRDNPDVLPPLSRYGENNPVKRAIREGRIQAWEEGKIQSALTQGILQGMSTAQLTKHISEHVGALNESYARRYARTAITGAQNAGRYESFRRAKSLGVDLVVEWNAILDRRTRRTHRHMHGERHEVDEPFEIDGQEILYPGYPLALDALIWNCFVGETNVAVDSEIVNSYKHEYSGDLIEISTASGVNFTCTPNHPILTPNGWVRAANFNKGDNLLVTSGGNNGIFGRDVDINHVHPTFDALHNTLHNLWGSKKLSMLNFNFHGDRPTSDVEVVSEKSLLGRCRDSRRLKFPDKIIFKNPYLFVFCESHFMPCFRGISISLFCFMRRMRKSLSFLARRIRHSDFHCFGTISRGNVSLPEYPINDLPTATIIRRELLDGLSGKIFLDSIVSINVKSGCTHVYNLQTGNGYYFVNNIINEKPGANNCNFAIAKNCRCTLTSWVKDYEPETVKEAPGMDGLSFEEWQNMKQEDIDRGNREENRERQRRAKK